jgi:hypothetical protein
VCLLVQVHYSIHYQHYPNVHQLRVVAVVADVAAVVVVAAAVVVAHVVDSDQSHGAPTGIHQ